MYWSGIANQMARHPLFNASGTIATGGVCQLLLPEHKSRSYLVIQNISDTTMFVEFGSARGTATLTSGAVTSTAVTNAGQGFTYPPTILTVGGGNGGNSSYVSAGGPNFPAPVTPGRPAVLRAVMSGSPGALTLASIAIDDPGSGYVIAPMLMIQNSILDPNGVATASASSGVLLAANGGNIAFTSGFCPTDPVSIFCATISKAFICYYAP